VLTVRGASGRPFSVVSRQPLTVPAGGVGVLRIRFAPGARRPYRATLGLTTNDPDERRLTVTLRGTGTRRR
jgi:hypothetical protein